MSVRNCQELGINLQKICTRLLANEDLIKLLYYEDVDPLAHAALDDNTKKKLFNDLICIVPKVGTREDSKSVISIYIPKVMGLPGNSEFKNVTIAVAKVSTSALYVLRSLEFQPRKPSLYILEGRSAFMSLVKPITTFGFGYPIR